jgi:hypothetical protein
MIKKGQLIATQMAAEAGCAIARSKGYDQKCAATTISTIRLPSIRQAEVGW